MNSESQGVSRACPQFPSWLIAPGQKGIEGCGERWKWIVGAGVERGLTCAEGQLTGFRLDRKGEGLGGGCS